MNDKMNINNDILEKLAQASPEETEMILNEHIQDNELLECKVALQESQDKYLHLLSDFQNYKKRQMSEQAEWSFTAQKMIVSDVLEIVDDFERALEQEKRQAQEKNDAWLAGFSLIYQALGKLLHKHGVSEISQLSEFDPEIHEALMSVDSPEHISGSIVHVLQKGYTFKGKVLRPAKVSIAK